MVLFFLSSLLVPLPPVAKGGSGLDSDAFLPFQVHAIHLCAHCIFSAHFVDGVYSASVEQNALGRSGFTAIDMSSDANVANA